MPKPPIPDKRVPAFYARFSSDQQNPASVADQLARLRAYLDRNGESTEGVREFSDSAVSRSMWKLYRVTALRPVWKRVPSLALQLALFTGLFVAVSAYQTRHHLAREHAPDFRLRDLAGNSVSLSQHR